ncbi:hypothetical protein BH23BAC3_BH23BAC3_05210 [soil metagenome]
MIGDEIYSGRLRIRACTLITENDKLLLVKQRVPTRSHPVWLPPGGEILIGESAVHAAQRETQEETGLTSKISRLAAIHEFIESPYHAIELYFLAARTGGELIAGKDPELSDEHQQILTCRFIDFNELAKIDLIPGFLKNRWSEILINNQGVIHVGLEG